VDVEGIGARGLDRSEHHAQVLGLAARHHGVDRDLLDRAGHQIGRHDRDQFVRGPRRAFEHREHAALGRRDQRQAVGPAARVHRLALVLVARELDAARAQARRAEAHTQLVDARRIDRQRAAARPLLRQPWAEPADA
jgi:hypothetical protein